MVLTSGNLLHVRLLCRYYLFVLFICIQVRDSLEKVRERMYGQFGGMQQSMQKLSQEIRVMNNVTQCECLSKSSL